MFRHPPSTQQLLAPVLWATPCSVTDTPTGLTCLPQLLGHDLDEAAIRDVLLACLDDGSMTQDDSSSKLGALVNKLMPGRPQRMQLACDAEVEAAARMLVQRLAGAQQGVEAEGEEEDDDKVRNTGVLWPSIHECAVML